MLGIPLLENKKRFLGVLVLGFRFLGLGCFGVWLLVSGLGFMVSWFRKFTKMSISCLLIDIDLISMIFKILFNGPSSLFGACLCQNR